MCVSQLTPNKTTQKGTEYLGWDFQTAPKKEKAALWSCRSLELTVQQCSGLTQMLALLTAEGLPGQVRCLADVVETELNDVSLFVFLPEPCSFPPRSCTMAS